MKHPASQAFFRYWNAARGGAAAPTRRALDPEPIRGLLGDSFVLTPDGRRGHPVRMAGTRVCALFGRDLKGESFAALWNGASHGTLGELMTIVVTESQPLVAGVTGQPCGGSHRPALELLLLPLRPEPAGIASVTGLLVALPGPDTPPFGDRLRSLELTGWRYLARQPAARPGRQPRHLCLRAGLTLFQADGGRPHP